jgi:DNA-binding response OmpR family regulator
VAGRARGMWNPAVLAPETWNAEIARAVGTSPITLRVLVIDNDLRAADFLELLLRAGGYSETRVAYTAHGALAIAEDFHPEVVLVELDMRDIGSRQLGQALRERAQLHRMRLIAVTEDHGQRSEDVAARDAGFERYLFKPVTALGLSACLTGDASGGRQARAPRP